MPSAFTPISISGLPKVAPLAGRATRIRLPPAAK
jgi:hypothetical protein